MFQKIYSKVHPVLCTNTHNDATDLVNHGIVKNIKTWTSWKRNTIFLRNKKILNLSLRWHILRSYRFIVEVTVKWWSSKSWHLLLRVGKKGETKYLNPLPVSPYVCLVLEKITKVFKGDCASESSCKLRICSYNKPHLPFLRFANGKEVSATWIHSK